MTPAQEAGRRGRLGPPPHDPNLGPRLGRFRSALGAAGGPIETLDSGRAGLDELWRWFTENSEREPGRLEDEAMLRLGGPLPAWYPREDFIARSLGSRLLQLTDGLAAHVTSILVATEPGADWVVEKDAYIKGDVPKLRLPGRRPGPIDEEIARFVYRIGLDPRSHLPNDPMTFIDDFAEFGDTRPRSYGQQSAKEARELLAHISSRHDAQVETFLDTVDVLGGPRAQLDFSHDSLVPLWSWLMSRPLPARPVPDREMRRRDPPWWYPFSGVVIGQLLGPELSWLATGAAEYVAETVFRLVPGSGWALGTDRRGADFRQPLLRIGPTSALTIHDRVPRMLAAEAVGQLPEMAGQRATPMGHGDLRDLVDRFLAEARQPVSPGAESRPEPAYAVGHPTARPSSFLGRMQGLLGRSSGGGASGSTTITFPDEVAHDSTARIDRFVRRLAQEDGVDRAFREDRELVHVVAPRLTSGELADLIAIAWDDAASARRSAGPG